MLEYQAKRKIRRRLYSRTALVIFLILAILLVRSTWNVYQKKIESERNTERAAEELKTLQVKQEALAKDITRLHTEAGVEEEIRSKFSVAKEGEKAIIIVESNQASTTDNGRKGFWSNIWDNITGWFFR